MLAPPPRDRPGILQLPPVYWAPQRSYWACHRLETSSYAGCRPELRCNAAGRRRDRMLLAPALRLFAQDLSLAPAAPRRPFEPFLAPQVISGTVFAYEKATNCLLLKQPGSHGGVSTLRLLRRNFISQINEALPPTEKVDLTLPVVDLNRGKLREKLAVEVRGWRHRSVHLSESHWPQPAYVRCSLYRPCLTFMPAPAVPNDEPRPPCCRVKQRPLLFLQPAACAQQAAADAQQTDAFDNHSTCNKHIR